MAMTREEYYRKQKKHTRIIKNGKIGALAQDFHSLKER